MASSNFVHTFFSRSPAAKAAFPERRAFGVRDRLKNCERNAISLGSATPLLASPPRSASAIARSIKQRRGG